MPGELAQAISEKSSAWLIDEERNHAGVDAAAVEAELESMLEAQRNGGVCSLR